MICIANNLPTIKDSNGDMTIVTGNVRHGFSMENETHFHGRSALEVESISFCQRRLRLGQKHLGHPMQQRSLLFVMV